MKLKPKMTMINFKIILLFTNLNVKVTMNKFDLKKTVRVFTEERKRLLLLLLF